MKLEKVKITAGVVAVASMLSILAYIGWKDFRADMKERYEIEHSHYVITDLTTGKSWESVNKPHSVGWDNITFKTSDDTGVILHGSNITLKRLP